MTQPRLYYVGDGFIPGVPARDLTGEEVDLYGGVQPLVASGLYGDRVFPVDEESSGRRKRAEEVSK